MSFVAMLCQAPILLPVLALPIVGLFYLLRTKPRNWTTYLAAGGLLLFIYANTQGLLAVQSMLGDYDWEREASRGLIGGLMLFGLIVCIPWVVFYRKHLYDSNQELDRWKLAVGYFAVTGFACSFFWFS